MKIKRLSEDHLIEKIENGTHITNNYLYFLTRASSMMPLQLRPKAKS